MATQTRKERLIEIIESLPDEALEQVESFIESKSLEPSQRMPVSLGKNLDRVIEEDRTLLKKLAE